MRVAPFVLLLACSGLPSPSGPSATGPGGSSFKAGQPGASGESGVAGSSGAQGAAGKDAITSGSRLKARYYRGADGSRLVNLGPWDGERDEACNFGKASDGKLRCLPSGAGSSVFRDDGCSVPAFDVGCAKYLAVTTPRVCVECNCSGGETRIHSVGNVIPDNLPLYYGTPGACATVAHPSYNTDVGENWRELGAEVPASSFVEGELITED